MFGQPAKSPYLRQSENNSVKFERERSGKGRNRKPKKLVLPILPALQKVIDGSPCGDLTFLVNDLGRPFTEAGFGNKFRTWCDGASLRHCTAHGLRKAG